MEILIPGLALVALMVYVSTRIKRSAARAYEREIVETDRFSIIKPEGYIQPVNVKSGYAFEAFSRDFGNDTAEDHRQVTARITEYPGKSLEAAVQEAADPFTNVEFGEDRTFHGGSSRDMNIHHDLDGVSLTTFHRIVEARETSFDLEVTWITEHSADQRKNLDELIQSFSVK